MEFPFDSASAAATRRTLEEAQALLEHYVLIRPRRADTPLLVAVCGATGAGKSTLVNSAAGEIVTTPGVLRPTTRVPVLVHHPSDTPWFPSEHVLSEQRSAVRVPRGVVLMDTPPLASIADTNRPAAPPAIAAADLWIFMTTAARYADAVPWHVLARAADRRVPITVVVNRVPTDAMTEIRTHLASLLAARGLGSATLFAVEETTLDSSGMFPTHVAEPVVRWLHEVPGEVSVRTVMAQRAVDGAIDHVLALVSQALDEAEVDVFGDAERAELGVAIADVRAVRGAAG
ncbi:GTPase [Phytoactinopolyspora limicola]|uniref:GTPase n=1 Tax=Phytoactinopolyspora limicola TaxID=2715536 RepID=UPI0014095EE0|nr:GTPase domain-containing protein [Phytoactinopolyspora limicola]